MPASLRDVRVASPAVNLPGPFGAALLIAGCGFAEQQATRKALKSAGLGVDDIGLFKVNETVADVPLIVRGSPASRTTSSTSMAAIRGSDGTVSTAVIERQ